jgi:ABC-type antimicrobial peptide transport system permease subunit
MSLGARPIHIRRLIGGQVVVLTAAGVAIGLAGSLFAGRWMRSLVYGVSAFDPLSLALSAIFVAAIALVAALVPTRRAASIDPAESLRMEG